MFVKVVEKRAQHPVLYRRATMRIIVTALFDDISPFVAVSNVVSCVHGGTLQLQFKNCLNILYNRRCE